MESFFSSFTWSHFWIILGVVLIVIEIVTVGFWALPLGLAALCTAMIAALGAEFYVQLGMFFLFSAIFVFSMQWFYRKYIRKSGKNIKTNISRMLGQKAMVVKAIKGEMERGEVKIGGETWSAVANDDVEFKVGDTVVVARVDGAKVLVRHEDYGHKTTKDEPQNSEPAEPAGDEKQS